MEDTTKTGSQPLPVLFGQVCPVCRAFVTRLGYQGVLCGQTEVRRSGVVVQAACPYPRVGAVGVLKVPLTEKAS